MAKSKKDTKATSPLKLPKKSISTSAIFKQARKKHSSRKDDPNHQPPNEPPTFTLSAPPSKKPASRPQKRKAPTPDHRLAKAFNDSLTHTKTHITSTILTAARTTESALHNRLTTSLHTHTARIAAAAASDEILFSPLADEGIAYTRSQERRTTTLGAQMRFFGRKVVAEERVLGALVEELRGVERELEVALETEWGRVVAGVSAGNVAEALERIVEAGDEGMQAECKAFEELIKTTGEKALEKMIESEKEFKIKQDERQQYMLRLFTDDDDDDDMEV